MCSDRFHKIPIKKALSPNKSPPTSALLFCVCGRGGGAGKWGRLTDKMSDFVLLPMCLSDHRAIMGTVAISSSLTFYLFICCLFDTDSVSLHSNISLISNTLKYLMFCMQFIAIDSFQLLSLVRLLVLR